LELLTIGHGIDLDEMLGAMRGNVCLGASVAARAK